MSQEVVVLGGGVGGSIVANQLVHAVSEEVNKGAVHITVISSRPDHVYQPLFLYMAFDQAVPAEAKRPERSILDPRISLIVEDATAVDTKAQTVSLKNGQTLHYDFLVIATGSKPSPELIPGLAEAAHWFYDEEPALKLRDALAQFDGGRVVLTVGLPHKCPVAPLEFTFMLDSWLRERGLREKTEIVYTYPIGRVHSLEPVANWAAPVMTERNIRPEVFFNMESVDPASRTITSLEGKTLKYDLLVTIPPHTGQKVIMDSGLGDKGGFIPVDRHSLLAEGTENVFVVGDATALPISKAGSTAHFEADVVAANLAQRLRGGLGTRRYDGKVFCFIESGGDKATYISFTYTNPPAPKAPSEMVHYFKLAYNRMYWLSSAGVM
ncbi:Pyridine nucleotide-disulfide oxidoreductase [Candidatus Hydrogenisulfobacillus filiaventi]|uniref:Pyridine nucleotide-disulfide oxidoreductase n=1 Tax=Candidatus Hydrogenisulfobacillus filiaventi TaxID=2707344 RepID=A0A6F8ZDM9_9FIRM|nr:FAD/NAD(P)-binding oxidoreductase [Bacillota bacterium]CAB1127552.1 Pyridine nucleotide-disulfide oxidoreductase [Candidatus Hydrogenisulfobacillus filiaventi]